MQAKHSGRLTECILVGETEIKSYFQSPIRIRTADLLARFRLARYVSNEGRRCIERKVASPYWRQHRFVRVCVFVCVCGGGGGGELFPALFINSIEAVCPNHNGIQK